VHAVPTATLVSWNLKGSAGPDVAGVVDHLRAEGADVVALQEVQWHQARRIARGLGARSWRWGFKHWPGNTWPEGMAVIGVTRPARVRSRALSHRWRLWSWRRRIVQVAMVDGPGASDRGDRIGPGGSDRSGVGPDGGSSSDDGSDTRHGSDTGRDDGGDGPGSDGSGAFTLVNVHLTPHREADLRAVETAAVLALTTPDAAPTVVSGDLNERPGGQIHGLLAAGGLRDGWGEGPGADPPPAGTGTQADPWPTNWTGWYRGTPEAPTRQLDYVYVSRSVTAVTVSAPRAGDAATGAGDDLVRFATLSDHLPVTAVLELP
jgi:endonuclease/exonuclease/phosphatase family metal-dependent hydrolase